MLKKIIVRNDNIVFKEKLRRFVIYDDMGLDLSKYLESPTTLVRHGGKNDDGRFMLCTSNLSVVKQELGHIGLIEVEAAKNENGIMQYTLVYDIDHLEIIDE